MRQRIGQSVPQLPLLIAGSISAFLYLSGFGSVLFLIPYAWLVGHSFASGVAVLCHRGRRGDYRHSPDSAGAANVIVGELLVIGSLIVALALLFVPLHARLRSLRALYRLLIVVALFMVVSLPIVYRGIQNPELISGLTAILTEALQTSTAGAPNAQMLEQLITNTLRAIGATYIVIYTLIPIISWWLVQTVQLLSPRLFRRPVSDVYRWNAFVCRETLFGYVSAVPLCYSFFSTVRNRYCFTH